MPTEKSKAQLAYLYSTPETRKKHRARANLHSAIRHGRIKREPCEVCGDPRSEGHHTDYDLYWQVRWLCKKHHAIVHALEAA